ncbi:hypothetical protein [Streptomyces althioticus]|uniref:hypothetical protein n=1 Tax=Streptomyces althioticus TaxID=83380 RepID=UPI00367A1986
MSSYNSRIERGPMAADRFTQISNALFRDPRLSYKAKGVFGLISTHRDGFGMSVEGIVRMGKDGRDAVRTALAELEAHGYLERIQQHDDDGRFTGVVYRITDMPAHLYELFGENAPDLPTQARGPHAHSSQPMTDFPTTAHPTPEDPHPKKTNTKKIKKEEDQDPAPSARSAGGVRSTSSSGSSARGGGGSAATEQKASPSKPPKLSAPQRKAVLAVESVLPPVLLAALPYGHIPNRNRPAVLAALESRTVGQLAERVRRRWASYGYEAAFHSGEISSLVGAALELLAPTPYCPDLSCEDGWMVDTGEQCRACVQRRADRRAARARGETPAGGTGADRPECVDCGCPFPGAVPDDGLCRSCAVTPTAAMEALLARWAAEDASARQVEDLYAEADRRRKQRAADRPTTTPQHGKAPF